MIRRFPRAALAGSSLALGLILTSVAYGAGPVVFDRSGNGIPDSQFGGEDDGDPFMDFDNDEDGEYDYGLGDTDGDDRLDAFWIDRNGDGARHRSELRMLGQQMPWAPLRSDPEDLHLTVLKTEGLWFMDYNDDDGMDEIAVDRSGDRRVELNALVFSQSATGTTFTHSFAMVDTDGDGDFDTSRLQARGGPGNISTTVTHYPENLQRQLPTFTFGE